MRVSSTTAFFALSSLCASYVLPFAHPQHTNDNLMRRELPYAVVNVDGGDQTTSSSSSSSSKTSSAIRTAVQTVTASSPPSPPVTVTVTTTASSTPIISSFPCSGSNPVSSLSLPPLSRAGTLITMPSPRPNGTASSVSGQASSDNLSSTFRATSTTDHR